MAAHPLAAAQPGAAEGRGQVERDADRPAFVCQPSKMGSPYIPVDSWVYPAMLRLYSLGFVDTVYLGMRPWTRASVDHMLEEAGAASKTRMPGRPPTRRRKFMRRCFTSCATTCRAPAWCMRATRAWSRSTEVARAISGTPLRDSFHLGSTVINDYGRPYQSGFNNYSGASGYAAAGRFLIYVRGEFQAAPSGAGYSTPLAQAFVSSDGTTDYYFNTYINSVLISPPPPTIPLPLNLQTTIPWGPIAAVNNGRVIEAYASVQVLNHVISFGKQDDWMGPAQGGAMAYSNNAENIYAFHINRIEPLHIPGLSRFTGPFRYEFLIGPLKGHTYPIDPWVHVEKISFRPTENLEFGFERTVIWGGKGHEPINLQSFLRSFFSISRSPRRDQVQHPGSRRTLWRLRLLLPPSPPPQLAYALSGLGGA